MIRRVLVVALAVASLAAGMSACSVGGHKINTSVVWCGYHLIRLERDVQHHRLGWAAFQTVLAAHSCGRVTRRMAGL